MASFTNHDLSRASLSTGFHHGFDPEFIESYRDHFVSMNPWLDFWATVPDGLVSISERDSPSHVFRDTAFYNEWLAPQGNADAAVGMSFTVDRRSSIQVAWHYSSVNSSEYDAIGAAILEAVKPSIHEAVRSAVVLRSGLEQGLKAGSLIDHIEGAAVILDGRRRLRDANAAAVDELRSSRIVGSSDGIVSFKDAAAQRWLEESIFRSLKHSPLDAPAAVFPVGDRIVKATLIAAPYDDVTATALLLPPRSRFLLVVKALVGGDITLDVNALQMAFGLSLAETKLCEMLVNGVSLSESAHRLAVSDGTVRQRIKMIFNKTGTHRQGELVAFLARFRIPGR